MDNDYKYLLKILPRLVAKNPSAAAIYQLVCTFKDQLNTAPMPSEIAEHLGLTESEVQDHYLLLSEFRLLNKIGHQWLVSECSEYNCARLSNYATTIINTTLPEQIQQKLLNPQQLRRIVKRLGIEKYQETKALAKNLKICPLTLRNFLAVNSQFATQLCQLLNQQAKALWGARKRSYREKIDKETFRRYYQDLLRNVENKNGQVVPADDKAWNTHSLLSLFLWKYKHLYRYRYIFVDETRAPQQGIELKFIAELIHNRFQGDAAVTAKYIHWIFQKVAPRLSGALTVKALQHNTFINQYLTENSSKQQYRDLPIEFVDWCENQSQLQKRISLLDLYWMRKAQLDNELEEEEFEVVAKAEQLGILPKGGNIGFPGK